MINSNDLHWAAGFIEGEGCFSFFNTCPGVVVGQKYREPLDKLERLFGGNIYLITNGKHWAWNLYGAKAIGLIFTIYPLLSRRRKRQARVVIDKWKARPGGKGGSHRIKTHCPKGHPYEPENTIMQMSKGYNSRVCRACRDERNREINRKRTMSKRILCA